MFRHANGSRETPKKRILQQTANELSVVLAQREEMIYFTKTHLADVQAIIKADETSNPSDEVSPGGSVA